MATAKKATTKKKPVSKKVTTKKTAASKAKKQASVRSFRPTRSQQPFMSFQPSRQTLYWLILSAIVLVFGMWIITLQVQIQDIYNSIDANNEAYSTLETK